MGAFANEQCSSLDIVFAKGGRSPLARLSSCSARAEAHPLLWRVASRTARGELVELVLARLDDPYGRLGHFVPCSDDISQWFRDDRA